MIGGKQHHDSLNELSAWLNNTSNPEWRAEIEKKTEKIVKSYIQVKISTSNAAEKIVKFNELKDKIMALVGGGSTQ